LSGLSKARILDTIETFEKTGVPPQRRGGKMGTASLLGNGDPAVMAAGEEIPLPKRSARTLAAGKSARIAIKAKKRILFIDAADVIAVVAKGNYVLLLHTSSSHMLRESISTIEEMLNLHGFVRIHRSVLVNAALVEEIHPWSTGEYVLRMRGGREFTVTRTYKKNLQLLAQLWIGVEGFAAE
jgi:DNA-binding LytR/AlgR family response regulator